MSDVMQKTIEAEKKLKSAYRSQVLQEAALNEASERLDKAMNAIRNTLIETGHGGVVELYDMAQLVADKSKSDAKLASKATDTAKEEFVTAVVEESEGVRGRGTHKNVNLVSKTSVVFPWNNPVEMGRAVEWMLSQQHINPKVLKMITIKTTPISFFQDAAENGTLPAMFGSPTPLITVREQTAAKVDALTKWILPEDSV